MTLGIGGYRLSNGLHILRARSLLSGRRMELMKFSRALEDFDDKSVCMDTDLRGCQNIRKNSMTYLASISQP
ncbi:MAG: hypothetical protein ACLRRK_03780 [Parasutterella sp.]